MKVSEIFTSCQGEGVTSGVPMTFIRLQGCNIRCRWCDTTHTQLIKGDSNGQWIEQTVEDIVAHCSRNQLHWVCITGGEPLMQADDLGSLVAQLRFNGHDVEVETNGTIPLPVWADLLIQPTTWVVDIKCPSSGFKPADNMLRYWNDMMPIVGRAKFVVADDVDLDYAEHILTTYPNLRSRALISPVVLDGEISKADVQRIWQFCVARDLRFSLQIHKIVWGDKRGV